MAVVGVPTNEPCVALASGLVLDQCVVCVGNQNRRAAAHNATPHQTTSHIRTHQTCLDPYQPVLFHYPKPHEPQNTQPHTNILKRFEHSAVEVALANVIVVHRINDLFRLFCDLPNRAAHHMPGGVRRDSDACAFVCAMQTPTQQSEESSPVDLHSIYLLLICVKGGKKTKERGGSQYQAVPRPDCT